MKTDIMASRIAFRRSSSVHYIRSIYDSYQTPVASFLHPLPFLIPPKLSPSLPRGLRAASFSSHPPVPRPADSFFQTHHAAARLHALLKSIEWSPRSPALLQSSLRKRRIEIDSRVARLALFRKDLPLATVLGFHEWLRKRAGFTHDVHTYTAVIGALGAAGHVDRMLSVVAEMRRARIDLHPGLLSDLLGYCGKARDDSSALRLWRKCKRKRGPINYNTMIDVLAQCQKFKEAGDLYLEMLRKKIHPDRWTFVVLVKHLVETEKLNAAESILQVLPSLNVRRDYHAFALLMNGYARTGNIEKVKQLARELKELNQPRGVEFMPALVNLKRRGGVSLDDVKLIAANIWPQIPRDDLEELVSSCLDGSGDSNASQNCVYLAGQYIEGQEEDGGELYLLLSDARMTAAAKQGLSVIGLANALENWSQTTEASLDQMVLDWDCQIAFQVMRKLSTTETIMKFFDWLRRRKSNHVADDPFLYSFVAIKLAKEKHFPHAFNLLNDACKRRLKISQSTFNTVLRYCSIGKSVEWAIATFNLMGEFRVAPNQETYRALLHTLCRGGRPEAALAYFREMRGMGVVPHPVSFAQLIQSVGMSGGTESAQWLFNEISASGLRPSSHHYASLMASYQRADKSAKVLQLFDEMIQNGVEIAPVLHPVFVRILSSSEETKVAATKLIPPLNAPTLPIVASGRCDKHAGFQLVYDIFMQNMLDDDE